MVMSPLDLRNQEFGKAFRGYSEDEVDSFMQSISEDYETIFRENISLKEQLSQKDESMWKYRDIEETLKSTLVLAQQTAEDVRKNAERDANALLSNANREAELTAKDAAKQAETIVQEAQSKAKAIVEEYADLQKQAQTFKANLRATLQAQLELLQDQLPAPIAVPAAPSEAAHGLAAQGSAFQVPAAAAAMSAEPESELLKRKPVTPADNASANSLSEDTQVIETIKSVQSVQNGILKEPRYNPGNQAE